VFISYVSVRCIFVYKAIAVTSNIITYRTYISLFHGIRALNFQSSMASSSNTQTNTAFTLASPTPAVQVKLDNHNYPSWLSQFMPILRTQEFMGIVDGSGPCPPKFVSNAEGKETLNPEYVNWTKKDQCLLSMILITLSEIVLSTVFGLNTSSEA
jgi:hypothetical protein